MTLYTRLWHFSVLFHRAFLTAPYYYIHSTVKETETQVRTSSSVTSWQVAGPYLRPSPSDSWSTVKETETQGVKWLLQYHQLAGSWALVARDQVRLTLGYRAVAVL